MYISLYFAENILLIFFNVNGGLNLKVKYIFEEKCLEFLVIKLYRFLLDKE